MLASLFNSRVVDAISRTASLISDEDQWMTAIAQQWLEANRDNQGLDVGALRAAPPALARRVVREALRQAGSRLTDVTLDHIESIRTLLDSGKSGRVIPLPGGITVAREFERLVFLEGGAKGGQEAEGFSYGMSVPGSLRVEELRTVFSARMSTMDDAAAASVQDSAKVFVDGDRIGPYVTIRNWKPGDYYRPAGWPAGKLKKLFLKARVPRSQRHRWPVIAQDAAIIWVVSFPVSREFLPDSRSKKIVAFEALPD